MKYKKVNGTVYLKKALKVWSDGKMGLVKKFQGLELKVYKYEDVTYVVMPYLNNVWLSFPTKNNYEDIEGEEFEYEESVHEGRDHDLESIVAAGINATLQVIEEKLDQLREEEKSLWTNSYLREFINKLKR